MDPRRDQSRGLESRLQALVCTYFSTPLIAAFYAWAAQSDFYFQFWTSGHVGGVLSPLMLRFSEKKFDTTFILVQAALKCVFTLLIVQR